MSQKRSMSVFFAISLIILLTSGCVEGNLNVNLGLGADAGAPTQPTGDTDNDAVDGPVSGPLCYLALSKAAKAELDSMGYSKTKHPNLYGFLLSSGRLRNSLPPCD